MGDIAHEETAAYWKAMHDDQVRRKRVARDMLSETRVELDQLREDAAELAATNRKLYAANTRKVDDYCKVLWLWLDLIADHKDFQDIAEVASAIRLAVNKSNYLYRRLYAGDPHRTEPCPRHEGRWSGYSPARKACGCQHGLDITGWLPAEEEPSDG